jgi:septal ring factor EnvC (AmiA/AmiB activator)
MRKETVKSTPAARPSAGFLGVLAAPVPTHTATPAAYALFCRAVAGAPSAFVTASLTFSKFYCLLGLLLLLGTLPASAQRHARTKPSKAKESTRARAKPQPAPRSRPVPARSSRSRAKSKAQLERERQANLARIQEAGKVLTQTTQKKEATLGQLNVIKEKLTVKQGQIQHISTQLQGIETNVHQTVKQVLTTQQQLANLKVEYAQLMYAASKTSSGFNQLMFLFAAESFNQFVLRLRYVRQYTEERQKQAQRIMGAQQQLSHQLDGLTQQRQRQKSLLTTQLVENRNLLGLKNEQDEVVQQLSQQEQGLRAELAQRVREEIARAARAARLAAAAERRRAARAAAGRGRSRTGRAEQPADSDVDASANPESDAPEETSADRRASRVALTPQTALLSSNFAGNKGRLPWPVARGFVAQHFGRHAHPVLKHVVVENRGVDIQTATNEPVRSVFAGRVLTVAQVPGMNTIVMIQHGEYFTVYARLRSVSVHEGQQVDARETIGSAATDADGTAVVQFQVWRNSANLNPEGWLGHK